MCYVSAFATEEANVVHSSLSLLLGQLAILSEFGREVRLVAGGDRWSSGVVGGPRVVVIVGAIIAFV